MVVTGTLRGGPLARGDSSVSCRANARSRVREIQVHGTAVERVDDGGRTALNLAGVAAADLHRGMVLTADPTVAATDRLLAAFRTSGRGPDAGRGCTPGRQPSMPRSGGADAMPLTCPMGAPAGIVRLAAPIALRPGDRFVLRRGGQADPVGGVVLDTTPPRGISRRRQTVERVAALADRLAPQTHGSTCTGPSTAGWLADVATLAADAAIAAVDREAAARRWFATRWLEPCGGR